MNKFTSTIGPPTPTWTGCSECQSAFCQKLPQFAPKLACQAVALRPTVKASSTSAARENAFAEVNTFWMSAPSFTPKIFTKASKNTMTMPVRLAVLTPISMLPSTIGPTCTGGTCAMCQSQCEVEIVG